MKFIELIRFDKEGLIPAVIYTGDGPPLTLCYMNREALRKTIETGYVYVYRRSRGRVMLKGETSGHRQRLQEIRVDCDGNSLAIRVEQEVAGCHKGYFTCYFRRFNPETGQAEVVEQRIFDPDRVYRCDD